MCSFRNLAKTNPHAQDRVQLFDEEFGAKALMNVGAARRALRQAKPRAVTLSLWPPIHCQNGASHPLIAPSRSYHPKSVALVRDLFALFWQISIIIFSKSFPFAALSPLSSRICLILTNLIILLSSYCTTYMIRWEEACECGKRNLFLCVWNEVPSGRCKRKKRKEIFEKEEVFDEDLGFWLFSSPATRTIPIGAHLRSWL